jgi:hypothetical protein
MWLKCGKAGLVRHKCSKPQQQNFNSGSTHHLPPFPYVTGEKVEQDIYTHCIMSCEEKRARQGRHLSFCRALLSLKS